MKKVFLLLFVLACGGAPVNGPDPVTLVGTWQLYHEYLPCPTNFNCVVRDVPGDVYANGHLTLHPDFTYTLSATLTAALGGTDAFGPWDSGTWRDDGVGVFSLQPIVGTTPYGARLSGSAQNGVLILAEPSGANLWFR